MTNTECEMNYPSYCVTTRSSVRLSDFADIALTGHDDFSMCSSPQRLFPWVPGKWRGGQSVSIDDSCFSEPAMRGASDLGVACGGESATITIVPARLTTEDNSFPLGHCLSFRRHSITAFLNARDFGLATVLVYPGYQWIQIGHCGTIIQQSLENF